MVEIDDDNFWKTLTEAYRKRKEADAKGLERAYDSAPEVPLSEERMKEIVDYATGRSKDARSDGAGDSLLGHGD